MSLQSHMDELTRRHRALEKQIDAAKLKHGPQPLEIAELKRKKLQIKDEIAKLHH